MTPRFPTPSSIFEDLRGPAPTRWHEFFQLYAPLVIAWVGRWGLQKADAEDLAHDVLLSLYRKVPKYDRRPDASFRSWLYTVVRRAAADRFRGRQLRFVRLQDDVAEPPDPWPEEREYQTALVHRACELIRDTVESRTWAAFERCKMQHVSESVVATDLGMTVNAVRVACSRVLCRIRELVDGFREEHKSGSGPPV